MKKLFFLCLLALPVMLQPVVIDATPQIRDFEKNGKKVHYVTRNGLQVNNCGYCHSGTPIKQIPGAHQNYHKGQPNYNKIHTISKCAGSGCHL